jgi:hypothetical protein
MAITKSVVKYIIITTLCFMVLLSLIGPLYFYITQDANFFSAMLPTLGIMLLLKGKIADYCLGNRDKHKPNYIIGCIIIGFEIIGNYSSIRVDSALGEFERHSLAELFNAHSYSLTVEYVSLLIICPVLLTIINLIKFRKRRTEVQSVLSSDNVATAANDKVENSQINEAISEAPLAQTPPPINPSNISEE